MKKTEKYLFKVAKILSNKYAESQSLQEIIENASKYGEDSNNGIMDYTTMLDQDKAALSLDVKINFGTFGPSINTSSVDVDPPEYAPKYATLPKQIKKYLEKNLQFFPQIAPNQTYNISYDGSTNQIATK